MNIEIHININLHKRAFGDAICVWFAVNFAPDAMPVLPGITRLDMFTGMTDLNVNVAISKPVASVNTEVFEQKEGGVVSAENGSE